MGMLTSALPVLSPVNAWAYGNSGIGSLDLITSSMGDIQKAMEYSNKAELYRAKGDSFKADDYDRRANAAYGSAIFNTFAPGPLDTIKTLGNVNPFDTKAQKPISGSSSSSSSRYPSRMVPPRPTRITPPRPPRITPPRPPRGQ